MTAEDILQQAILCLRELNTKTLSKDKINLSPEEFFISSTAPSILALLRVTLRCVQIDPESVNSVNGYARELNLAKAVISACTPIYKELLEQPFDDNSDV
jgi:hypothetical protein